KQNGFGVHAGRMCPRPRRSAMILTMPRPASVRVVAKQSGKPDQPRKAEQERDDARPVSLVLGHRELARSFADERTRARCINCHCGAALHVTAVTAVNNPPLRVFAQAAVLDREPLTWRN